MANGIELLMAQVDGKPFGVQVSTISEVIPAVETTTFIDKPKGVLGLINLRGNIVPVHALRHYIGSEPRELIASDQIVVIRDGEVQVGIAVDSVDSVKTFQEEQLFAQSLSPMAFKILKIVDKSVVLDEIRSILE